MQKYKLQGDTEVLFIGGVQDLQLPTVDKARRGFKGFYN